MLSTSRVRAGLIAAGLLLPQAALAQPATAQISTSTPPSFRLSLAPEANVGAAFRLGSASSGYPFDERAALNFDLGLYLGLGQRVDVGVHYLHTGIGVEKEPNVATATGVETRRSLDMALLTGRFFAYRNDWAGIFLGITVGAGWQAADHRATQILQPESSPVFVKTRCQERGSAALGLGVGLGGEFAVDKSTSFLLQVAGMNNRLSSDPMDDCTSGAGSTTVLLTQLGFRYRFDLGGASKDAR